LSCYLTYLFAGEKIKPMPNSSELTRRYLVASDFDQTLSFNDSRGPESTALIDEEREQRGLASFSLEAGEDSDRQLEWVLGHLGDKPTELQRYVYMIRLCDRNERLFLKVLMSHRICFLLATDSRRRLHDIWLQVHSLAWHPHFDPCQTTSHAAAARL